jgi:hypothetical protein
MKRFLAKTRTALINRLHALYAAAGETGLRKNDLMTAGSRKQMKGLIPHDTLGMIAETIEREREAVEGESAIYREKLAKIVWESGVAPYIMSIPGGGPFPGGGVYRVWGEGRRPVQQDRRGSQLRGADAGT